MTPEERLKGLMSTADGRKRLAASMINPVRGLSPFRECPACRTIFPNPAALRAHGDDDCCVAAVQDS